MTRPGDEGRLVDWLEQMQRDVDALKARPPSVSIGPWVIEERSDGALVARNTTTGATTRIARA
jgi:hypothetical protein